MKYTRKILTMILAMAISVSHILPVYADTSDLPENENGEPTELELEDLDPSTLHIHKLGEVEEQEEPEEEISFDFNQDDMVRVSIVLDKPSTIDAGYSTENIAKNRSAVSYRDSLIQQQAQMAKTIERKLNRSLDVKWNLTLAANIISANVRYGDINKIRMINGVKKVFLENRYEAMDDRVSDPLTANTSTGMVGATAAWAEGYTGAGSRIAIIDTGLDKDHQSVNADAFERSLLENGQNPTLLTRAELNSLKGQLNSGSSNYISSKIPYGYNYVDGNTDITHLKDQEGEHGSHVAGIAAANRLIKQGNNYVDAASTVYAVGMAPDAQLIIMKVFGKSGGAYDSDYFAAIEDAIVLGCDSANLSLGSGYPGFTYAESDYQEILNNLSKNKNNKMVVAISAGNSYGLTQFMNTDLYVEDVSMHTGGSPGTYINSLGVAAAENIGTVGAPLVFNGNNIFYSDSGSTSMTTITGSWPFVYIDALGEAVDYQAVNSKVSLKGKIVIVNRGDITFVEKGNNAVNYNPKALIIANNENGTIAMGLDDFTGKFPMVSISLADAIMIKNQSTSGTTGGYTYYTGTISVTGNTQASIITARENAEMTVFSSWGVPGSLLMKPEIVAPGGNIYSLAGENYYNGVHGGGQDQYEFMSGTSMAAPHITGLAAVVAQYVRENDFASKNSELVSNYSVRAIVQSLLMSTATPMKNNGKYVSILQQGAGLAEVHNAVKASSVIMMSEKDGNLTSRTGAAADGKVKVEFGDDPDRNGNYTYSFRIFNISDTDMSFNISTDLFTQATYEEDGAIFMDQTTVPVDARVNYTWEPFGSTPAVNHDVDRDGDTDIADAQLLADYLSGKVNESALDRAAGEMDGDGELTSHDIYLLLNWESEEGDYDSNVVPAHSSREVTVTINISDAKINDYPKGFYVEGYTKVESNTVDNEGVDLSHIHTIPLLGFYGSWTDPSMFDNTSYTDTLYGTEKVPYTGKSDTNYLTVTYNGNNAKFSGNPYITEEKFPYDRLAVNSNSQFNSMFYSLYRSAGTTGFAISRIDEYDGKVTEVLDYRVTGNDIIGLWYSENDESWQNTNSRTYGISTKPNSIGLNEGDLFRIGFYAIPEYNAMITKDDLTNSEAGLLSGVEFKNVLLKNNLGKGAFIGYDFVVDNTAPQINNATLSNSVLTVSVDDDRNLAYVAVLSLDGSVKYYEKAPGKKAFTVSTDISKAISQANGYVVAFAGDYAGNEAAVAIKVNNNGTTNPYNVNSISVNPNSLDLYKGNNADITATVLPLTASDRTVTWSSSNPSVATVDQTGHVTAIGSGSTTIKATSNANSALSATCNVRVTVVDKSLNGIVWDENGEVYFSGFNTNNLPTWTKLHNDDKQLQIQSAFMQSTSRLYAATLDTGKQETVLYTVNRNSYELTEYGTNFVFATDMAIGASSNAYRKYIGLSYVFGTYLVAGPIAPEDDGEGNLYCGIPYAVLDCAETTGGAYFAGIACNKRNQSGGVYYILDENGTIWQSTLSNSNSAGFVFSTPKEFCKTGISTSFLYQSLYCDSQNIYWSHCNGDNTEMIIINISSKSVYHAGSFGENVWPVAGLYVDGKIAPNSSEDDVVEIDELSPDIKQVISRSELLTDEICLRYAKENDKFRKTLGIERKTSLEERETGTVNVRIGSTQFVSGISAGLPDKKVLGVSEISDGISSVALKENKDTTNGMYSLVYDKNVLGNPTVTFTDSVLVKSYNVDEVNGIITFVYADKTAIKANTVIADVKFSSICNDTQITVNTRERNDELSLNETEVISLPGKGHDWGEPQWSWDIDLMHATAVFTCQNDASHQESIRSNEAVIDEIAPTHQTDGKRTYTVSVTGPDGKTYQDKKEITLPALIYNFEFTEFRWDDDYTKAGAVYTDEESGETRVITVNSTEATVQATCTVDGSITYTVFISATESYDNKEHGDTRTVPLYAIGHSWGEITYSWSEDYSQATASVHCLNDDTHVISETVKTSSEITGKPTCTEMGETTYTAAFTNKMFTSQKKAVVNIPATGHKEGDKVIENEIEPNCTKDGSYDIVIYCSECGEQLSRETVKVNPTGHKAGEKHRENEVAATCTSAGSYDEVVRCTVCNEIITSEHVVVKATGHNYDKWQYDGEAAKTHTHVCANDPDHKETEPCSFDEGVVNGNVTTYTCRECGGKYTVTASEEPEIEGIVRVAGDNRYQTAESITYFIMEAKAEEKLEAIVLACGGKFADALSGSYLAAVNDCPIMLIDDRNASEVEAYLRTVMNLEGKVYILGGTAAVSSEIEKEIRKTVKNVIRLAGDTRYSTNLEILKDSTLTSDVILVATGKDFADSLSASAAGLPLLLVKDALDDVQKSYLKDIRGRKFIILGGEKAVSSDIEKRLKAYGSVERIAGADRFETSVRIAEKLFEAPKCAVLAFSNDFPDGLCGGPLAQMLKAPVILTRPDKASVAREYLQSQGITDGVVLGGTARIDDDTVRKLYGLSSSSPIELYQK